MIIWYSSSDEENPDRFKVFAPEGMALAALAKCCADHFGRTEGRKRNINWPRDITLYEEKDGPPTASFHVTLELTPTYFAHRKAVAA